MPIDYKTKTEACIALTCADDAWHKLLRAAYGRSATAARYDWRGRGVPGSELRMMFEWRQVCVAKWLAACQAVQS